MVLFTMIARIADGLPLAATMQEDEQVNSVFSYGSNVIGSVTFQILCFN